MPLSSQKWSFRYRFGYGERFPHSVQPRTPKYLLRYSRPTARPAADTRWLAVIALTVTGLCLGIAGASLHNLLVLPPPPQQD